MNEDPGDKRIVARTQTDAIRCVLRQADLMISLAIVTNLSRLVPRLQRVKREAERLLEDAGRAGGGA